MGHYGVAVDTIKVLPFGPGIESEGRVCHYDGGVLKVLVVASDWIRKGGAAALKAAALARAGGLSLELTIVGDSPSDLPEWAHAVGGVDRARMSELYAAHHVLLEMARANAGGVTLTDAHAHGLPVIATSTGGTASIVADGRTGYLVEGGLVGIGAAAAALAAISEPELWSSFSRAAVQRSRSSLNWDVWADNVVAMCRGLLPRG
ncbi:hypothetical protein SCMU_29100 [Sinomonas cyclohexanicum]|uniref:D-inositol 3-phosphate glycosyltransferase n=1 Tax=Sinomonas cyclohexanicum TaxID=322009 RepID=A0ABM7PXN8_SINCY|nr:hypothetical protein SCMU_29100 [Corynebacterium cyclohexanicum]